MTDSKKQAGLIEDITKTRKRLVEGEIVELRNKIKEWEKKESENIPNELDELHEQVLFVHSQIEHELDWLIVFHLFDYENKYKTTSASELASFAIKIYPVLDKLRFFDKVKICKTYEFITGAQANSLLSGINMHRNSLSHRSSKLTFGIKKYENRENYLEALKDSVRDFEAIRDSKGKYLEKITQIGKTEK